jgi:hypothetical protein
VLIAIAKGESRKDGVCTLSETTIARHTTLSRQWVNSEITGCHREGLVSANRCNGRAPRVEINWPRVIELAIANGMDPKGYESTCPVTLQVQQRSHELTEPSLNPHETLTCQVAHDDLSSENAQPVKSEAETCRLTLQKGFKGIEGEEERAGSRQALTRSSLNKTVPGSTLTEEEFEARKKLCDELRPAWARERRRSNEGQ